MEQYLGSHFLSLDGCPNVEKNNISIKIEPDFSQAKLLENFHNFESTSQSPERELTIKKISLDRKRKQFPCKDCGKNFSRKDNLKTHYTLVHAETFKYSCNKCGLKFDTYRKFQNHPKYCQSLEKINQEKSPSKRNVKKMKNNKESVVKAEIKIKEKKIEDDDDEDEEKEVEEGEEEEENEELSSKKKKQIIKEFTCKECDRKFSRKNTLKSHYIQFHTNAQKYDCDECGEEFKMWSQFSGHMRFVHKKKYFPKNKKISSELTLRGNSNLYFKYSCEECGEKFRIWGQLTGHMRHLHGKKALNKILHKDHFTIKTK